MRYHSLKPSDNTTICAIATPMGSGAIASIRLSGPKSFDICSQLFVSNKAGKNVKDFKANSIHFGTIVENDELIDEVLISVFKAPHSFTGEDIIEISCHGSAYIQQRILECLINKVLPWLRPANLRFGLL